MVACVLGLWDLVRKQTARLPNPNKNDIAERTNEMLARFANLM
jgi:hypothetical protein